MRGHIVKIWVIGDYCFRVKKFPDTLEDGKRAHYKVEMQVRIKLFRSRAWTPHPEEFVTISQAAFQILEWLNKGETYVERKRKQVMP